MAKIWIIDNSADTLDCLSHILTRKGFTVISTSIQQAINTHADSGLPNLFLIDIKYHDNAGKELCKGLKEKYPFIPVILSSASPKILHDIAEHADGILEKPFEINTLMDKINSFLNTPIP